MADSEDFAKWAAQFLQQYESVSELGKQDSPSCAGQKYPGVTIEASRLLESVDAGGVPAFVTQALLKIARENGLNVAAETTPNQIVESLRLLAAQPPASRA